MVKLDLIEMDLPVGKKRDWIQEGAKYSKE